jgi:hypothetical protein
MRIKLIATFLIVFGFTLQSVMAQEGFTNKAEAKNLMLT